MTWGVQVEQAQLGVLSHLVDLRRRIFVHVIFGIHQGDLAVLEPDLDEFLTHSRG